MKIKPLLFCGILAPIVGAVVLGGVLRPGYSQVLNFVSDLIGSGAPNKRLVDPLFELYDLFCLAFGLGTFLLARASLGNSRRIVALTGADNVHQDDTYRSGWPELTRCHGSQPQPDRRSGGASHDRRIRAVAAGDGALTAAGAPGGSGELGLLQPARAAESSEVAAGADRTQVGRGGERHVG